MPIMIQACTLAGKIIEKARWEVEFPSGVQDGHLVAINIPFDDPALNGYLARSPSPDCLVDKNGSEYSVALSFKVMQVRHMIETDVQSENAMGIIADTIALVYPINRLVEHVALYLLAPKMCDQKFIYGVRGSNVTD